MKIQIRRDTAAAWTSANPVLAFGEQGAEVGGRRKTGDGITHWVSLPYDDDIDDDVGGGTTTVVDTKTVPWGMCQSELAHGSYAGFATEAEIRDVLQGIKDIGAQHVRVAAFWDIIEPVKDAGYTWTGMDRFFSVVDEYGLTPLVCITGPAPIGATIGDLGQICGAIAARYGSLGSGQLKNYEIWNEQNNIGPAAPFNTGSTPFGPTTYAAMLAAASPAIRAADPEAFILMGGLMSTVNYTPPGGEQTDYLPSTYLTGMYAHGAKPNFDAINVHYYSGDVSFITGWEEPRVDHPVYADLKVCRAVADANGDDDKPFWITEFGLPQNDPVDDPLIRGEWLIEQAELLVALGFIDVWFLYNYKNAPGLSVGDRFGLVDEADVKQQPAWDIFSNINGLSPVVPKNFIDGSRFRITSGAGTAGVLNIDINGNLSIAPDASGGGGLTLEQVQDAVNTMILEGANITKVYDDGAGTLTLSASGGGGGGGGTGVAGLVPARAAGTTYDFPHGLGTKNVDITLRRSYKPGGTGGWDVDEMISGVVYSTPTKDIARVKIDRDIIADELIISAVARPGTYDTTGPTAGVLTAPTNTSSSVGLVLTGGVDAGVGNAVAYFYRDTVKIGESADGTYLDAGLPSSSGPYSYTAQWFDLFGNPGTMSNAVTKSTLAPQPVALVGTPVQGRSAGSGVVSPTTPPVYNGAAGDIAVAAVSCSHVEWVASNVYTITVNGTQSSGWSRWPEGATPPDVNPGGQPSGSVHFFYKKQPSAAWTTDTVTATFSGGGITPVNATITIFQLTNVDQTTPFDAAVVQSGTNSPITKAITSNTGDYTISISGLHGANGTFSGPNKTQIGATQGANGVPGYCHYVAIEGAQTSSGGTITHSWSGPSGSGYATLLLNARKAP